MPLSPMELHEEELGQLRRLVQSPGWELFKVRVLKRVESSEREKAKALREGNSQQAVILQARIDGLKESLDTIYQYMEGLAEELQKEESVPAYP